MILNNAQESEDLQTMLVHGGVVIYKNAHAGRILPALYQPVENFCGELIVYRKAGDFMLREGLRKVGSVVSQNDIAISIWKVNRICLDGGADIFVDNVGKPHYNVDGMQIAFLKSCLAAAFQKMPC